MSASTTTDYAAAVNDILNDTTPLIQAIQELVDIHNLPDAHFAAECDRKTRKPWRDLGNWIPDFHSDTKQPRSMPALAAIESLCKAEMQPIIVWDVTCWTSGEAANALAARLFEELATHADIRTTADVSTFRIWAETALPVMRSTVATLRDRVIVECEKAKRESARTIPAAGVKASPTTARNRTAESRPLTPRQTEVMQVVAENNGNIAAAARALARDPKTVRETYNAGLKKLGRRVLPKAKTIPMRHDRRGQVDVSEDRR